VQIDWSVIGVLGTFLTVVIGAAFFATVSMLIAVAVKTRERFMGMGQVITMPLFFASNAIYPLQIMPDWLQTIALANPLSYLVDLLRGFLVSGTPTNALLDWLVLLVALAVAQLIAGATFKSIVV
jgi:ABC-2 type transport system permease protein